MPTTPKPYFFLLGGKDLEMKEIKNLLIANHYQEGTDFMDKNLQWGATLSQYKTNFHPTRINAAIELTEDITPPPNYLRIDHHNEWSHKPASIEQVAQLLQIPLTRYQTLVAANDKGYIPALIAAGATKQEIQTIRRQDRAAQGVTPQDEHLALLSIQHNAKKIGNLIIVRSLTDKFSPIPDLLYGQYRSLLIYTNPELTFYGIGKKRLTQKYKHLIQSGQAYSGADEETGYFGTISFAAYRQVLPALLHYPRPKRKRTKPPKK